MLDNPHTLVTRFHTPDPRIAARELAAMLAEERARAEEYALGHRFSWIEVWVAPLCFGPVLPGLAWCVGLFIYRSVVDSTLDIDRALGDSFLWLVPATLVFIAAWVQYNVRVVKHDPTKHYWQQMPEQGLVELERHTLLSATNLWSNAYDPDCNTLMQWADGKLHSVQDSGVSQWLVAKTQAGHWLVLKKEYPGPFSYERQGRMPAPDQQLHPSQELAIAFAPGTNLSLGQRFSGAPVPVVNTSYWLAADELKRLIEVAHHWTFAPPDRYGVVNDQDAEWLERLLEKAL